MSYLKDELAGFVPVEQSKEIMKDVARGSSLLRLSKVSSMESDTKKIPVMTEGPGAYWVGEGERISTSNAGWIYPELKAKKLAVIIPVTKEKLNDTTINVFEELREPIAEAFYKAIDAAGLFGTNSPWTKNIMGCITTTTQAVGAGTNATLDLDVSDAMAEVEAQGYDINGFVAKIGVKNSLRKLRDTNGNQLYCEGVNGRNGAWDSTKADLIGGDWDKSLVGIREGIEYEILKEATLEGTLWTDDKPLSLAEQDMIAIKATMRLAFLPILDKAFCAVTPAPVLKALSVESAVGSTSGKTAITVSPELTAGNSYKYKTAASVELPAYDAVCTTGYTNWNGSADITATTGNKILIVEVDENNKAKKAGIATVTSKS